MLDAFIIEKIKREQEERTQRVPLQIEDHRRPPERPPPQWRDDDRDDGNADRGVVIIDF